MIEFIIDYSLPRADKLASFHDKHLKRKLPVEMLAKEMEALAICGETSLKYKKDEHSRAALMYKLIVLIEQQLVDKGYSVKIFDDYKGDSYAIVSWKHHVK